MLGQVAGDDRVAKCAQTTAQSCHPERSQGVDARHQRTRKRLTACEKQFGMTTEEFERRYAAVEIDESLESIEWLGEIKMLRVLSEQKLALDGTRVK